LLFKYRHKIVQEPRIYCRRCGSQNDVLGLWSLCEGRAREGKDRDSDNQRQTKASFFSHDLRSLSKSVMGFGTEVSKTEALCQIRHNMGPLHAWNGARPLGLEMESVQIRDKNKEGSGKRTQRSSKDDLP